ncbi:TLC domain-containing protein At5g14285 [Impatiens glandulifera]|uniref:TLC domain-containing protein At5g14285 n=1 Tax=Impatiens glandulifera TaxID=253017 RepID=UPI001FB14E6D|nr:TLC domain-containing protein At5g14285 [Impatiens glandulifera]
MEIESLTQFLLPTNVPIFFTVFLIIYLIAYFIVFRKWNPNLRPEAASCMISFAHGTPAVFLACYGIFTDQTRSFASINTQFQNMVLDYSISYFLMDLCHYLIFYPKDVIFIGHHLATLFVFITCRYVALHGAFSILVLLIIAEVTSLCQNTWTLAGGRRADSEYAAKVYDVLSPPFYVIYSIARGLAGPLFMYKMIVFFASGAAENVIPRWIWVSWVIVVSVAISVSWLWISNLWIQLFAERSRKLEEKIR